MNIINEQNQASYEQIAKSFSATRSHLWHDLAPFVRYVDHGDKVLDLGCGNGRLLELLKGTQVQYLGVDFSQNLIAEARQKHPGVRFEILDLHNLDKLNERFDIVFCISVLNHFPFEDQRKIIKNISSVIKTGGHLLMVNWNLWNIRGRKSIWVPATKNPFNLFFRRTRGVWTKWRGGNNNVDLFYYAFNKKHLRQLLKRAGFEVIENYYARDGRHSSWLFGNNIVTIAQFCSSELERKISKIHGYGIFTKRKLLKDEKFYFVPLNKLTYHNYKRYAYVGNGQYVNDTGVLNWVNHSCNPNVRLDINRPDPVLIALRDIEPGEEIACNYDATEEVGVYRKCLCKEGMCKGHFGRDRDLKVKLFS